MESASTAIPYSQRSLRLLMTTVLAHAALVRTGNLHILAILRHRPASHLDSLPLQFGCKLVVSQRLARIFLFDQLFHLTLQQDQRKIAALWPVHSFGEEEAKFVDALWGMDVLIGNCAAHRR